MEYFYLMFILKISLARPPDLKAYCLNADPDLILFDADLADPDPTFLPDADPDSDLDPSFQMKA
jgi:hypothetical protein